MAKEVDVFGFDELQKAFVRMERKYAVESDAMLAAQALQAKKRVKQKTPKVTGNLSKGWRDLKPKAYKGGTVKVSRVQNAAPHAHLYEYPRKVYTTRGNRMTGKVTRYNETARRVMGIKNHGQAEGHYILRDTMRELESKYPQKVADLLDKVTEEVQV